MSADVALGAIRRDMRAGQRKGRQVVHCERGGPPSVRRVTILTGARKCSGFVRRILRTRVVGFMAAQTGRGRPCILTANVALSAIRQHMRARQREGRLMVIRKRCGPPIDRAMALFARRRKCSGLM